MLIEWKPEFETGIASVDHEHRTLINLLNELHGKLDAAPVPDEIERFLGEVYAHVAAHFALEERQMRVARYEEYAVHKHDHDRLLDEIRSIMERQATGAYADYAAMLGRELRNWFVEHFRSLDPKLHRMLGVRHRF